MKCFDVNIFKIIVYPYMQGLCQKLCYLVMIQNNMPSTSKLPFVDDYLAALLAQASALISTEFHAVVLASGFSVSEWRVLATLTEGGGISIGELAQISVTKQPTVTRLLDRMEAKDYVERFAHETDRRITMVRITHQGQSILTNLIRQAKEHEHRVLEPFGHQKAEDLKATLRKIIELHRPAA
jgi:DNA-binding MarR family transcriptional regulator